MNQQLTKVKRALISVYDKTGIVELAQELQDLGIEILSSGGTFKKLTEAGIKVQEVSDYTGFPEMMDGRIKTLHPKIHGGILALRDNRDHKKAAKKQEIEFIDLVVVNLYPFSQVIKDPITTLDEAIENIDIGGPTLLRAAAKNYGWVGVVVNPEDYDQVISELKEQNGLTYKTRQHLAWRAFAHTTLYDSTIYNYLTRQEKKFPNHLSLNFTKFYQCRYGENPHQGAALYQEIDPSGCNIIKAKILHGKQLSFNNIVDADAALSMAKEFSEPAAVVVKHGSPSGISVHQDINVAFAQAYQTDAKSAFGGIICLNRELTKQIAEEINKVFVEIVIAPSYQEGALEILTQKENVRILELGEFSRDKKGYDYKKVEGGMLVQDWDKFSLTPEDLKVVTKKEPAPEQLAEILFNWQVLKNAKSNSILITKDKTTLGLGAGQVSRIDAVEIALMKAGDKVKGAVLGSDGFFPFRDSIDRIAQTGIEVIVQPGGSLKDEEVIKAADERNLIMVFTERRAFKH